MCTSIHAWVIVLKSVANLTLNLNTASTFSLNAIVHSEMLKYYSFSCYMQVYNNFTCSCQCDSSLACSPMFMFDEDTCSCLCDSTFSCPTGRRLDSVSCECVCNTICPPTQSLNKANCFCECPSVLVVACPANQVRLCVCACLQVQARENLRFLTSRSSYNFALHFQWAIDGRF